MVDNSTLITHQSFTMNRHVKFLNGTLQNSCTMYNQVRPLIKKILANSYIQTLTNIKSDMTLFIHKTTFGNLHKLAWNYCGLHIWYKTRHILICPRFLTKTMAEFVCTETTYRYKDLLKFKRLIQNLIQNYRIMETRTLIPQTLYYLLTILITFCRL